MVFKKTYVNPKPLTVKDQACAAKAEANKIANAKTFDALISWACPKATSHGAEWYMTCVNCAGMSTCKPGKRVLELLEEQTKPSPISSEERVQKMNRIRHLNGRKACMEAMSKDDPVSYLMQTNGISINSAIERIRRWSIMYSDIVTNDQYVEARKIARLNNKQDCHGARKASGLRAGQKHHAKMLERIAKAFSYSKGPIEYLIEHDDVSRASARKLLCRWSTAYPEINDQYGIKEFLKTNNLRGVRSDKIKEEVPEMSKEEPMMDDEMSIDDLLNEAGVHPEAQMEEPKDADLHEDLPIPQTKPAVETLNAMAADIRRPSTESRREVICDEMSAKRVEILMGIEHHEASIKRCEELIQEHQKDILELKHNLEALDTVAKMMGLAPKSKGGDA